MNPSYRTMLELSFRTRHGDQLADLVTAHGMQGAAHDDGRAALAIKRTLQSIVAEPTAADRRVDALTAALLMEPAWRRLRAASLDALTPVQLAECAQYALDHLQPSSRPLVDRAAVAMALALLIAARSWHAPRRIRLLREALALAFEADYARATSIIGRAQRQFREVMLRAA